MMWRSSKLRIVIKGRIEDINLTKTKPNSTAAAGARLFRHLKNGVLQRFLVEHNGNDAITTQFGDCPCSRHGSLKEQRVVSGNSVASWRLPLPSITVARCSPVWPVRNMGI